MLFALSKILWGVLNPANLLLIAYTLGVGGMLSPWARAWVWGRRLVYAATAAFLVITLLPIDYLLIRGLEERIPPPPSLPAQVDGVIVLGGVLQIENTRQRGTPHVSGAAERITEMARLATLYPEARIIFTSGSASLFNDAREADALSAFLPLFGLSEDRVIIERNARNTRENALFAYDLAGPKPGETWLLITSAWHMPRAYGAFRVLGWEVIPYPVDYETTPGTPTLTFFDALNSLARMNVVTKEALGLIYYRVLGWTDQLYPAIETPN